MDSLVKRALSARLLVCPKDYYLAPLLMHASLLPFLFLRALSRGSDDRCILLMKRRVNVCKYILRFHLQHFINARRRRIEKRVFYNGLSDA